MEPIFSGKAVKSFESRNEKLTLPFNSLGLVRLFNVFERSLLCSPRLVTVTFSLFCFHSITCFLCL